VTAALAQVQVEALAPPPPLALGAMDEHRIGLKPVLRRVGAPLGERPVVTVRPRYQWLYLYGFVQPQTGRTEWLLMPTVSVAAFEAALQAFAEAIGAGSRQRVLLVLDQAGWHVRPRLTVPEGIELVLLPPYSPELQPAERLWPLTNEALANRAFADLDELEQAQAERCLVLQAHPEALRSRVNYHWWPQLP